MIEVTIFPKKPLKRRRWGIFYTPEKVANIVLQMVKIKSPRSVFDPCFGGGALLRAAMVEMATVNVQQPGRFLAGVDVDRIAVRHLRDICESGGRKEDFLTSDFFDVKPDSFERGRFDLVVCNPPFVRHHFIPGIRLQKARASILQDGFTIPLTSAYWAYFLLHSLVFLSEGGDLLFLLPVSILQSRYAKKLRQILAERFRESTLLISQNGFFPRVQERIVVLHARGYGSGPGPVLIRNVATLGLREEPDERAQGSSIFSDNGWIGHILHENILNSYGRVARKSGVNQLGSMARISIGTVTGANSFFLLNKSQVAQMQIPRSGLRPFVTRAHHLSGIKFTKHDFRMMVTRDEPCWLIYSKGLGELPENLTRYFESGRRDLINERYHCKKRAHWFEVGCNSPPDAFFHYMSSLAPHVVINQAGVGSTNTIHQLRFSERVRPGMLRAVAMVSISTLTQLSCELLGRRYGGGVLKLEPGEVKNVLIPNGSLLSVSSKIERHIEDLLRSRNIENAMDEADEIVKQNIEGISQKDFDKLREGWRKSVADRLHKGNRRVAILPLIRG